MDLPRNVGGRDRIVRAVFAVVLAGLAIGLVGSGQRAVGVVAALGAVGLGFNAVTCFCGVNEALGIDTTDDAP
jgi:hypothetical protein